MTKKSQIIQIILAVIITAVIASSGTYYFLNTDETNSSSSFITDSNQDVTLDSIDDPKYIYLEQPVSVYDEYEKQIGFLAIAQTNQCGSDCSTDTFFISNNSHPSIKILEKFSAPSLGSDLYEKDKNIYRSTFVWGENEGHFGCHNFKVEKIKYINGEFIVVNERYTQEKYAFDRGDAQGKCNLFPGLKTIIDNGF